MKDPYPCTIIADRYNGSYSGGAWTAWPLDADQIPEGATEGDGDCMIFWDDYLNPVGKGATPDAALADLIRWLTQPAKE